VTVGQPWLLSAPERWEQVAHRAGSAAVLVLQIQVQVPGYTYLGTGTPVQVDFLISAAAYRTGTVFFISFTYKN